ncbi:MAG TPA: glycosyltransferase [Ktedonobacteraceae bacterium]
MQRQTLRLLDRLACGLCALFALDRLLKHLAVWHFFAQPRPEQPLAWPAVTLLQPITRGTSNLLTSLRARACLDYPATITHLLICDADDTQTQALVAQFLADFPALEAEIVLVTPGDGWTKGVATKIRKLQAALPRVTSEIVCFVDDDVAPRPETLRILLPRLSQPGTGAAFGLPCYTNWRTPWSGLMSGFVNSNMLLNFVALTYLCEPFRITGHFVAFKRRDLAAAGWLEGLEEYIDDDFELARRLRSLDLRSVQTPLIYDIDNDLPSWQAYQKQLKRWFVLPRQAMLPSLSLWQRVVSSLTTASLAAPGALLLLTLCTRRRVALSALLASLGVFGVSYLISERGYLKGHIPVRCWPLLAGVALLTPLDVARHLLSSSEIEWRGQLLYIGRDGKIERKR